MTAALLLSIVWAFLPAAISAELEICLKGDLILGGLLTIGKNENWNSDRPGGKLTTCSDLNEYFVTRSESLLFAVERANAEILSPTGIRLGLLAFQTCDSDAVSSNVLQRYFRFEPSNDDNCTTSEGPTESHHTLRYACGGGKAITTQRLLAFVGSITSSLATQRSEQGYSTCVPIISTSATSMKFSNLANSLTTQPLNNVEAEAIIAVLVHLNVSRVTVVSLSHDNKEFVDDLAQMIDFLMREFNQRAECPFRFSWNLVSVTDLRIQGKQRMFADRLTGDAIVVIGDYSDTAQFFEEYAGQRADINGTRKLMIVGDGIADILTSETRADWDVLENTIGVQGRLVDKANSEKFLAHLGTISLSESCRNPWLAQVIAFQHNCSYGCGQAAASVTTVAQPLCQGTEKLLIGAQERAAIRDSSFDYITVATVARAVLDLHRRYCLGKTGVCERLRAVSGNELFVAMFDSNKAVSCGNSSNGDCFFNSKKSGQPFFNVLQLRRTPDGQSAWNDVGTYDGSEKLTCKNVNKRLTTHGDFSLANYTMFTSPSDGPTHEEITSPGAIPHYIIYIIAIFGAIIVVGTAITIALLITIKRRKKIVFSGLTFLRSKPFSIDPSELIHYDPSYEIPATRLRCDENTYNYLGEGHTSIVYRGTFYHRYQKSYKEKEGLTVAIKMPHVLTDPSQRRSLIAELVVMQAVGNHLNVLCMLGAVTKGQLKVVTDYCIYGNLCDFLRNWKTIIDDASGRYVNVKTFRDTIEAMEEDGTGGGVPTRPASVALREKARAEKAPSTWKLLEGELRRSDLFCYCYQVSCGMEFLSSKGVVHRDLAARNILLDSSFVAKISDFGLSRQSDYYKLQTDSAAVPAAWMPVEVMAGHGFTSKSDVWSFGVLIWEVFTLGGSPYETWFPSLRDELFNLGLLIERLKSGDRLDKPHFASDQIYSLMQRCWHETVSERPAFHECKTDISAEFKSDFPEIFERFICFTAEREKKQLQI